MNGRGATALLVIALVAGLLLTAGLGTPGARAATTNPVTGTLHGPTVLALQGTGHYTVNGSGGPAFAANGTQVGNLTVYFTLTAANLTGLSITPDQGAITGGRPVTAVFKGGALAETVTITAEIASVYQKQNQSINLTYTLNLVTPYVVSATIVDRSSTTVLAFPVQVFLDDNLVGTVTVPTLTPHQSYNLSFQYPTLGLSAGAHTFSISLAAEHGLVSFANGATVYSSTFYVTGSATSYTLWYVAGGVAFFGVLFIFMTRVAARRRGALRR
jgi:hypothetical protein